MSYNKLTRDQIAERVAQDIPDGAYVNLGIGLPTKIASYLPADKDVFLHSENGLLAFGPPPAKGEEDPELINAGKEFVTMLTGGAFFHHGDSFAMMRGGHLDIAVLGHSKSLKMVTWPTGILVHRMQFLLSVARWIWPSVPRKSLSLPIMSLKR